MTPVLVTAPATPLVSLADMKAHLRVTDSAEDALITALEKAAVAYLDGWKGVLGRAIQTQTWEQEFDGFGTLRLALPDVSSVDVSAETSTGAPVTVTRSDLKRDAMGWYVETEGGAAAVVTVQYVCAMPATLQEVAKAAVKLMVGHWFRNREAASGTPQTEIPLAVGSIIAQLCWSQM